MRGRVSPIGPYSRGRGGPGSWWIVLGPLYTRDGVAHAWLIDPEAQTLEAYELRGPRWAQLAVYGVNDTPAAAPFEAATFRVADLWS